MSYENGERLIFKYTKEGKSVCGDPLVIDRKLRSAFRGHDINGLMQSASLDANPIELAGLSKEQLDRQFSENEQIAEQARDILISGICKAFNMKVLDEDGTGSTEKELLDVLFEFDNFLADLKKKAETTPTSQPPTSSTPPVEPNSNTPTTLACC
jgi:hypothetical protein